MTSQSKMLTENFSRHEMKCKHTNKCLMHPKFMAIIQDIRTALARPMIINSGYRDVTHPIERDKDSPGEHTYGLACDVKIYGTPAITLIAIAAQHGIKRIGVNQQGPFEQRFIHLGLGDRYANFPQSIWSY